MFVSRGRLLEPMAAELTAERVSVKFAGITALESIDLTLRRDEIVGLIGPNGAGKTTLVNCLTGFQKPTAGRILLAQDETSAWSPERFRAQGIARTFQAGRLFRNLSVAENVEVTGVALGLSRREARAQADIALKWLGLERSADIKAGALPYTDERRVGIARALVVRPAFLLMDEPAAGMSDSEAHELVGLIASIPARFGCGVLVIEHNMSVVMGVSHRIYVLNSGEKIAEGTPREIQNNPAVMTAYLGAPR